jgi:serine/threonine protein kinase
VFLARHPVSGERVALKLVVDDRGRSGGEDILSEASACATMDHPNVVRAIAAGRAVGFAYLVLEYVDGVSLGELVRASGPLSPRTAADYIRQAAEGLGHVHTRGWVHGDVKPDNLLVTPTGVVKVIDLGMAFRPHNRDAGPLAVAPAGSEPLFRGTFEFTAPEVIRQRTRPDARADVYSLGATLTFLLTGRVPYPQGLAETMVLWALTTRGRPRPCFDRRVPGALADIVRRMLAVSPSRRYQRPDDVAAALTSWARTELPE